MSEKKTAIITSIIGILVLGAIAAYVITLTPVSNLGFSGTTTANINPRANIAYGADSALDSSSNILGASVEYKAGVISSLKNIQQSPATSDNQ